MLKKRLIPLLLLHENGLVKTTRFGNPSYVGDPINTIHIFNEKEVDELIVLDISASKNSRGPNFKLIEKLASECFMPLSYGGGIRNIEDARSLFGLGLEKISIQSAAFENLSLLSEISGEFGSQSVIFSLDLRKNFFGRVGVHKSGRVAPPQMPWMNLIQNAIQAGAGEIFLNFVNCDGVMMGMDLELIKLVSESIAVPLIAAGGVGSLDDMRAAVLAGANGVAVGSFFVFSGPHRAVLITYPQYSDILRIVL